MKLNKHEESNLKRLQSLKKRIENEKKAKEIIQLSLKNKPVELNKSHLKFDSESDDEITNNHENKKTNADNILGLGSDEENEDFEIKPQFQGKHGQRLLEMQSRVGMDSRFKIDDRFAVDDDAENIEFENAESELQKNLSLLHQVVGSKALTSSKKKTIQFSDPASKRYDPSKTGHSHMEMQPTKTTKAERKKKKKAAEELPSVTKDRFYKINPNDLKQAFGKSEQTENTDQEETEIENNFSLLTMLGRDPENQNGDSDVIIDSDDDVINVPNNGENYKGYEKIEEKTKKTNKFATKVFKHDSSDSENEMEIGDHIPDEKLGLETEEEKFSFFLLSKLDPRVTDGPLLFCNNKQSDQIRKEWVQAKDKLKLDYKKKHRDAVRILKKERRYQHLED
uniref:Nucleolar protein 8-like n=1 Tax=Ciona intestinalis TaxID=7719 RepID=F6ZBT0_CIOIN|nr:nucleolar protein 8-like [Ciona intestinalis]|eukprot:XP_002129438.1 nucleolar protein 8-like [Ciona intestinalis]